jgi:hypothetical protein
LLHKASKKYWKFALSPIALIAAIYFVWHGLNLLTWGTWGLTDPLDATDCFSKNVRVQTTVIAELELSSVQQQIFGAGLVKTVDDPVLENAPLASA